MFSRYLLILRWHGGETAGLVISRGEPGRRPGSTLALLDGAVVGRPGAGALAGCPGWFGRGKMLEIEKNVTRPRYILGLLLFSRAPRLVSDILVQV